MENLNLKETMIIDLMLRGHSTNSITDAMIQSRVLALYKNKPEFEYAKNKILELRNSWIAWRFNAQREWHKNKHHPKFHDSFQIRQSYVAPHENNYELQKSFNEKARAYAKTIHSELFTGYNAY